MLLRIGLRAKGKTSQERRVRSQRVGELGLLETKDLKVASIHPSALQTRSGTP